MIFITPSFFFPQLGIWASLPCVSSSGVSVARTCSSSRRNTNRRLPWGAYRRPSWLGFAFGRETTPPPQWASEASLWTPSLLIANAKLNGFLVLKALAVAIHHWRLCLLTQHQWSHVEFFFCSSDMDRLVDNAFLLQGSKWGWGSSVGWLPLGTPVPVWCFPKKTFLFFQSR